MVAHRRGGRPTGVVGRRKQRATARRRSQSTSDENSSDGGSITRCKCGETHNQGLMVQCDKCEVWQHCECMGLEQPDIPDHYYCEQCKPEDHKNLGQNNRKTKRKYVAAAIVKAPKKRMTLNSREASMSLEDVLAARSALEMYESHMDADSPQSNPSSPPPPHHHLNDKECSPTHSHDEPSYTDVITSSPKNQDDNNMAIRENGDIAVKPAKRRRDFGIKLPDTIDEKSEPPSSTVSSVGHEDLFILKEQEEFPEPDRMTPKHSTSTPPIKPKRKQTKQTEKKANGRVNGRTHGGKRGKPRSRTSTPVRESSPIAANELDDSPEDIISTVLSGHFSPTARALSPPAKTRQPHARMSISEMNRRANQILEYISSIQVEMASKENDNRAGHGDNTSFTKSLTFTATNHMSSMTAVVAVEQEQMRDDDDNDSLSSASTIPLIRDAEDDDDDDDDDDDVLEQLDKESQSSMEIMDMLTRKLIKFQRRFGSRNRALYEEALTEGEGRVTRSREASGNMKIYRNMMAH